MTPATHRGGRAVESPDALQAVVSASLAPMAVCQLNGRLAAVNSACLQLWGYSRASEMVGRPAEKFWQSAATIRRLLGASPACGVWVGEATARRKDGKALEIHLSAVLFCDEYGTPAGFVLSCFDLSGRKRAEAAAAHQKQLRRLAGELSLAEEHERQRIAGDLHDEVGQLLALAKMKMDLLDPHSLREGGSSDSLREAHELVRLAADKLPSVIFDLNSPVLYREDLEAALKRLTGEMETRHGLRIAFRDGHPGLILASDLRVFLFRAVRELLFNVVKHARAKNVKVSVHSTGEELRIAVEDDGVGCAPVRLAGGVTTRNGFGLSNIRERLALLGGRMKTRSSPGQGTLVTLSVSLGTQQSEARGEALSSAAPGVSAVV